MGPVPTHIAITCPNCGHENVFAQPYPYHAGYGNQGFLYSEGGNCTLTWGSFDPDYVDIVGQKHPWELTEAERQKLEDRLAPAPDGSQWLFRNPARCSQCGSPISGPITDSMYYLRHDGSVDRDASRSWGPGLKDVLKKTRSSVPWNVRDVWLAVAAAAVILVVAYGTVYLVRGLPVKPNLNLWEDLAPTALELLFLIPVWWFVKHKYRASLKTLGYRKFPIWVLLMGVGFVFAFYVFDISYAALLSQFGQQVQSDLTPLLRSLVTPWPVFFSMMVVAPLVEETFFRGFVFAGLRSRMHWASAAAISAALFAAAHLELTFFIPAFALGFLFAYLYQRTESILPGMILHFLINSIAVIALAVAM